MSDFAGTLRSGGTGVSALCGRLIRAARQVRAERSLPAMERVSRRMPAEVLGGDLLQVLSKPLRALLDVEAAAEADHSTRNAVASFPVATKRAGRHGNPVLSGGDDLGRSPRALEGITPDGAGARAGTLEWGASAAYSRRARESVEPPSTSSRRSLGAAIDCYWSQAEVAASESALTSISAPRDGRESVTQARPVPPTACERFPLPAPELAARLRAFEGPRAFAPRERLWNDPATVSAGAARASTVSAGGESIKPADDLAGRIADLLRDQALAHGIDVS